MTDLLPIWKTDLAAIAQTVSDLVTARLKEKALLTTFVNLWNAKSPVSTRTALNAAFTAYITQYNICSTLIGQLTPQVNQLAADMAPTLAILNDAQRQQLLANRAQYLANAYILIANLCLQYTQADALTEAQYIYNALVQDINAAWANKLSPAPKVSPIPSTIFDTSNALNLYVGPNVPASIGAPASFISAAN